MSWLDDLAAKIEAKLLERGGCQHADEIRFCCPSHADDRPSASYNTLKRAWNCKGCGAKGGAKALAKVLGIDAGPDRAKRRRGEKEQQRILVATYEYRDADGVMRHGVERWEPKSFTQFRINGNGARAYNLNGIVCPTSSTPARSESASIGPKARKTPIGSDRRA